MSNIDVKVAVGVGCVFAIVSPADIKHIELKNTNTVVAIDGVTYPLYKGATFAESQKVDALFDGGTYVERSIDEYVIK